MKHDLKSAGRDPARRIYEALTADSAWSECVLDWQVRREELSGPFERKRKVGRGTLAAILGVPEGEVDLARYLYSVELCVLILARRRLQNCIEALRHRGLDASWPEDLSVPALGANSQALDQIAAQLHFDENLLVPSENPAEDFGLLIEQLIPKQIRHTTGAYFTPAWLADELVERTLEANGGHLDQNLRILEPSCGPGVFLCSLANRLVALDQVVAELDLASHGILVGYEFNELWAFVARVSLLELQSSIANPHQSDVAVLSWHRCVRHSDFLAEAMGRERCRPTETRQLDLLTSVPTTTDGEENERFDLIVGNPPWVNWEYLPIDYRDEILGLWPRLGIFDLKALEKANCKEDVASLFTIAALRLFGTETATIGFLLPQSLFQSSLLGRGLRTVIGRQDNGVKVLRVDEWSALRPFGDAANNTISMIGTNQGVTQFPVPWMRHKRGAAVTELLAAPIATEPGASWLAAPANEISMLARVEGSNAYRGRTGVFTGGANGVYYVDPLGVDSAGIVRIRNVTDRAKRCVESVVAEIESDFLFPIVTGRDVRFWGFDCSKHLICPHTVETRMSALVPGVLSELAPRTLAYLQRFSDVLAERRGFAAWERSRLEEAFYAIQRIGDYSFAPFKVSWKYISSTFVVAVVTEVETDYRGPISPLVNDKVMSIGLWDEEEAFFVGALLSAFPFRRFVESHMVSTQISPSVVKNLRLPKFDPAKGIHQELSIRCREGHDFVASSDVEAAQKCLNEVNALAFELLEISDVPESSQLDAPL